MCRGSPLHQQWGVDGGEGGVWVVSSFSPPAVSHSHRLGLPSLCDPQQDGDQDRGPAQNPQHFSQWELAL